VTSEDEEPRPLTRDEERAAARARIEQQDTWVDLQLRRAVQRGDFDDLPGLGKPLSDLDGEHDPDWWVKRLVEREQITVLPPALQLRREDALLDDRLDRLAGEAEVRREVTEFNERVRRVLYSTTGWPPVVTRQRRADEEVERWRQRLTERRAQRRKTQAAEQAAGSDGRPRRRWRRRRA
jgi:hypothetical protein